MVDQVDGGTDGRHIIVAKFVVELTQLVVSIDGAELAILASIKESVTDSTVTEFVEDLLAECARF